jgi:chromosome segregation ATPase
MLNLESGQKALASGQKKLGEKLDALEAGQKELHLLNRAFMENLSVTGSIVSRLDEEMNYIKGSNTGIEQRLDNIQTKIENIDHKIDRQNEYVLDKLTQHDMAIFELKRRVG